MAKSPAERAEAQEWMAKVQSLEQQVAQLTHKTTKLVWRDHNSFGQAKRVWREDWAGDQFEVMGPMSFGALNTAVNDINRIMATHIVELVEAEDN